MQHTQPIFEDGSWNEEYYEILEFLYWEPQHIGRKKNPDSPYDSIGKVLEHIKKMEVSLNHIFDIFFSLLPLNERKILFESFFGVKMIDDAFSFSSKQNRSFEAKLGNVTQADLLFQSEKSLVCIELKVGAKSSLQQFVKYLLLNSLHSGDQLKKLYLLFLGKDNFPKLFKEKFESFEDVRNAYRFCDPVKTCAFKSYDITPHLERMKQSEAEMIVSNMTYPKFSEILQERFEKAEEETLRKLYQGMIRELEERELAIL